MNGGKRSEGVDGRKIKMFEEKKADLLTMGGDHQSRGEDSPRLFRGDGHEDHDLHEKRLRRGLHRHVQQASRGRLRHGLAVGRDRRNGGGRGLQHYLPEGDRRGARPGRKEGGTGPVLRGAVQQPILRRRSRDDRGDHPSPGYAPTGCHPFGSAPGQDGGPAPQETQQHSVIKRFFGSSGSCVLLS